MTISAGSLILPIEDTLIEGGAYMLSHAGAAQARVWQGTGSSGSGAYASVGSGLLVTGLTGATQTNVEFSTGTVLRPQLEPGTVATAFERKPHFVELLHSLRYFTSSSSTISSYGAGGWGYTVDRMLSGRMRAVPAITFATTAPINIASASVLPFDVDRVLIVAEPSAAGSFFCNYAWTASAEI